MVLLTKISEKLNYLNTLLFSLVVETHVLGIFKFMQNKKSSLCLKDK